MKPNDIVRVTSTSGYKGYTGTILCVNPPRKGGDGSDLLGSVASAVVRLVTPACSYAPEGSVEVQFKLSELRLIEPAEYVVELGGVVQDWINSHVPATFPDMPYARQWVLEEVIKKLQASV